MFTELQRAELRLRAERDKVEALVQELTRAHREAQNMVRDLGQHEDDLRVDISRQVMARSIDQAKRRLNRLNAVLRGVEGGQIRATDVDLNAPERTLPDEDREPEPPGDFGEGPQIP